MVEREGRGRKAGGEKRRGGERKMGREWKKLKCGSHGVVVDIERRYKEWMDAEERDIE